MLAFRPFGLNSCLIVLDGLMDFEELQADCVGTGVEDYTPNMWYGRHGFKTHIKHLFCDWAMIVRDELLEQIIDILQILIDAEICEGGWLLDE